MSKSQNAGSEWRRMRVQVGTKWNRLAVQSQVERTICAARLMSDMGDTFYRDDAEREILYRAAASRLIFTHSANESSSRSFVCKIARVRAGDATRRLRRAEIVTRVRMRNYYYPMLFSLRAISLPLSLHRCTRER